MKESLKRSLAEVQEIRSGSKPKRSYVEMIKRIRSELKSEETKRRR